MLDHWADVVQMLLTCIVFTGLYSGANPNGSIKLLNSHYKQEYHLSASSDGVFNHYYSVKRSDVTCNDFEWLLDENNVI